MTREKGADLEKNADIPGWDADYKERIAYIDTLHTLINKITRELSYMNIEGASHALSVLYINCLVLAETNKEKAIIEEWERLNGKNYPGDFNRLLAQYKYLLKYLNRDLKILMHKIPKAII